MKNKQTNLKQKEMNIIKINNIKMHMINIQKQYNCTKNLYIIVIELTVHSSWRICYKLKKMLKKQ